MIKPSVLNPGAGASSAAVLEMAGIRSGLAGADFRVADRLVLTIRGQPMIIGAAQQAEQPSCKQAGIMFLIS